MTSIVPKRVMQDGSAASGSLADGVLQDRISGEVGWQQKSYPLGGDGTHALVWVYSKDGRVESGSDRGWVDYLQWTPSGGGSSTTDWEQITYTYDPSGRRIAKDVDGEVTRYVYDGDQCIAEYDANDVLLRKYVHGPSIDEPICMIEVAEANAAYFYHYDALGSVVALSDADGDTVQVYEYDVYGQVAASDPNHPNRFMFTGREFDTETGLYYYRARYYNPTIGRFLQTDPIGYEDGMNLYAYCGNNPWNSVDPHGLYANAASDPNCKDVYAYGNYNDCCCPSFAANHPQVCDPNYWDKARAAANAAAAAAHGGDGGGGDGGGGDGGGGDGGGGDCNDGNDLGASVVPPPWFPVPPGDGWVWEPTPDKIGGGRWWDPEGGTWRPHPDAIDPGHGGDHWDYNPPGTHKKKDCRKRPLSDIPDPDPKPCLIVIIIGGIAYCIGNIITGGALGG